MIIKYKFKMNLIIYKNVKKWKKKKLNSIRELKKFQLN